VAFDPARGLEADATVEASEQHRIHIAVGPLRAAQLVAVRPVLWIQALSKADKCDAIVRDATELGATRFVAAAAARSIVRLDDARGAERRARWTRVAQEAARQCGRADPPMVEGPAPWQEVLASVEAASARFCLYERAEEPLAGPLAAALASGAPLAFAAGPEGGLEEAEVDAATERGWLPVSLGPFILRAETVAAAVLGAVRIWSPRAP
jgi:16S rRNA (uracil1498-N3)-methyltransferase